MDRVRATMRAKRTNEYVATCMELRSLSWLAKDRVDALKGVADTAEAGISLNRLVSDRLAHR